MKWIVLLFSWNAFATTPAMLGVVNKAESSASFINLETGSVQFTASAGYLPHEIAVSVDGKHAFVSNYGKEHVRSTAPTNKPGNTLSVVDLDLRATVSTVDMDQPAPCAPHGMVPSRDGRLLYVTCEARGSVSVVDLVANRVVASIPTGQEQSHMLVLNHDETRGYTANFSSGSISILDLKSHSLISIVKTGAGNEGVSLSEDDRYVFASAVLDNRVFKIDAATGEVLGSAATCRSPVRVTKIPGNQMIVNCSADNAAQVFDVADLSMKKQIALGRQPIGVAIGGGNAYFANMLNDNVAVLNLTSLEVTGYLSTGHRPDGLVFIPGR